MYDVCVATMSVFKKWVNKKKLEWKFRRAGAGHSLSQDERRPRQDPSPEAPITRPRVEPTGGPNRAGGAAMARFEKAAAEQSSNSKLTGLAFKRDYDTEKRRVEAERREREREASLRSQQRHTPPLQRRPEQVTAPSVLPVSSIRLICPVTGVSVLEGEIEEQMTAALLSNLEEEPLTVSAIMIHTLCRDKEAVQACIGIICKYLDNVSAHPDDPKYRKIKWANKTLQEKVGKLKGGVEFLQAVGFERKSLPSDEGDVEFLVLPDEEETHHLVSCKEVLTNVEALKPELDRCVCVFKSHHRSALRFDLPDSFFALTKEEFKREQQQRKDQLERESVLRTKVMRDREVSTHTKRYRYAVIRVRLPDEVVLQGTFKPGEKVETVRTFVIDCMKEEAKVLAFSLMDPAGKRVGNEKVTLSDAKLVPSALMTLAVDPEMQQLVSPPYLKAELLQSMKIL